MKLFITQKAHQKLKYYVSQCETEISGLGKLNVITDPGTGLREMVVTQFEIFEQVVSGTHSDLNPDALGKFLFEKIRDGEDPAEYRVWWHSHATMQAFFSGTDVGTINGSTEFPYLISLVTNHKGDLIARVDIFDPVRVTQNLEVEVIIDEDLELKELCRQEIEAKVRQQTWYGGQKVPKRGEAGEPEPWRGHKYSPEGNHYGHEDWMEDLDVPQRRSPLTSKDKEKSSIHKSHHHKKRFPLLDSGTSDPKQP